MTAAVTPEPVRLRALARPAGGLLAALLSLSALAALTLAICGVADDAVKIAHPLVALEALIGALTGQGTPVEDVTVNWGQPLSPDAAFHIVVSNLGVVMAPIAAAALLHGTMWTRRRRRLLDLLLVLFAVRQLWTLVILLAAHPREMTLHVAAYLPLEFGAFSLAGAAYLAARRRRNVDLLSTLAVSAALVVAGALVETATAGRIG